MAWMVLGKAIRTESRDGRAHPCSSSSTIDAQNATKEKVEQRLGKRMEVRMKL